MNNLLSIINGITKTLELTEKTLPLITNYKKEIGNVFTLLNKVIAPKINNTKKEEPTPIKKVEQRPTSTLTFFQ